MYVSYELKQVLFRIQQECLVAALEQVPGTRSDEIYPFRRAKGYILHDPRKGDFTHLHDDVDVVCNEAEAVDAAVELLNGILQNQIKPVPVSIFKEDRFSCVAAKNDMVDSAGIVDAWFSCHG